MQHAEGPDGQPDATFSFGAWVASRRRALRLTQRELATRAVCSTELLRKIEADARRPSRETAAYLARHLGLEGTAADLFVRAARGEITVDQLPAPATIARGDAHRPLAPTQASVLVGRAGDLEASTALLKGQGVRMLTITGPAGVGKTSLAVALAAQLAQDHRDGACVVLLAQIADHGQVAPAILERLGVTEHAVRSWRKLLLEAVQDRQLLLVLDNFEHVLGATVLVRELLAGAPELTVVVTSRERLNLSNEHVYRLAPLDTPAPGAPHEQIGRASAAQLFVQRARMVRHGFELTPENADTVAELCRLFEGIPLAIELGAARCRTLAPATLLELLRTRHAGRLALLRGGARDAEAHQRALATTIEWSYQLLSPDEQRFLCRLSVFAGGWDIDAAAAIWDGGADPIDLLTSLADKSLVIADEAANGTARFRLLEATREYAGERLAELGQLDQARSAHAHHYLSVAEHAQQRYHSQHQSDAVAMLDQERHNLYAALSWTLAEEGRSAEIREVGVRLAAALADGWFNNRSTTESRRWIERALAFPDADRSAYGRLLLGASRMRSELNDTAYALGLARRALALADAGEEDANLAWALESLGKRERRRGNVRVAQEYLGRSIKLFRTSGPAIGLGYALQSLGTVAREMADLERAEPCFREALAIFRSHRQADGQVFALYGLGDVAADRKDLARAADCYHEALAQAQLIGDLLGIGWARSNLGDLARQRGDLAEAGRLLEQALVDLRAIENSYGVNWALLRLARVRLSEGDRSGARRLLSEAMPWMLQDGAMSTAAWMEVLAASEVATSALTARLLGAARTLRDATGTEVWICDRPLYDQAVAAARAALGDTSFDESWAAGCALGWERVAEEAREGLLAEVGWN